MAIRSSQWPTRGAAAGRATPTEPRPELSVVVPVHDEEENVEPLYASLQRPLEALGRTYEIIVVDDGSRDETYRAARPRSPPTTRV